MIGTSVCCARVGNDLQDFGNPKVVKQRAFRGALNDRSVGHRIGERNPELDQTSHRRRPVQ